MSFRMGPALLFCPADRTDRFDKAAERADAVILDLEDAVDAAHKDAARAALIEHPLDPVRTIVRVNAYDTPERAADLEALRQTEYRTVMVAKATAPRDFEGLDGFDLVALCETAGGVVNAPAIAAHQAVVALMWGAEDLMASLGGTSSRLPDGRYRQVARHARSAVLLAAGAYGKAAIDAIHVDIDDFDGLRAEASDAAASGFAATACIHPGQVATIRDAYRPSDDDLEFARAVLAAATDEAGVFAFRGRMVDEPVLRHAAELVRRAGD